MRSRHYPGNMIIWMCMNFELWSLFRSRFIIQYSFITVTWLVGLIFQFQWSITLNLVSKIITIIFYNQYLDDSWESRGCNNESGNEAQRKITILLWYCFDFERYHSGCICALHVCIFKWTNLYIVCIDVVVVRRIPFLFQDDSRVFIY